MNNSPISKPVGLNGKCGISINPPGSLTEHRVRFIRDLIYTNIFYRSILPTLPPREKWHQHITNIHKGEIVLMEYYGYIGRPRKTSAYSSDALAKMGLVGLYYAGSYLPYQTVGLEFDPSVEPLEHI